MPSDPAVNGWRLLPWQHLAATVVPAVVLVGSALLQGSDEPVPAAEPDAVSAIEQAGAPAGILVVLSQEGAFVVHNEQAGTTDLEGRGRWIACTTPVCQRADDWDHAGLVAVLRTLKRDHPDLDTITLAPAAEVPFRAVTETIAAARFDGDRPLFPYAVVSRRIAETRSAR